MSGTLRELCVLAVLPLFFSVCSLGPGSASSRETATIDVSCDDFMRGGSPARINRTIEVAAGQTILVRLCSNVTTGFSWETARGSDQAVLQELEHKVEAPASNALGAAGREVWTFKARQSGTAAVSIDYSQPWAGGTKASWQFALGVTVR